MNPNTLWARTLVDELARAGVREVCLAPGSRSTPLVLAAARDDRLRLFVHLDERSASFFALGVGKATGRPAAVITTSGTAAANLFPAVVESCQAETPLLLLTADRPPRLRDSDANQAIDQVKLFGGYVRAFFDLAPPAADEGALRHLRTQAVRAVAAAVGLPAGPVHLNVPFAKPLEPVAPTKRDGPPGLREGRPTGRPDDEVDDVPPDFAELHPLAAGGRPEGAPFTRVTPRHPRPAPHEVEALSELLERSLEGVIVAGPCPEPARTGDAVIRLAAATGFPLLADPLSGARYGPHRGAAVLGAYDLVLRDPALRDELTPDLVVRFGQSPTSAALDAWLEEHGDVRQVVVDPGHRWKDHQAVAADYLRVDPASLAGAVGETTRRHASSTWRMRWRNLETAAQETVVEALDDGPFFEGTILADVTAALPEGSTLFVSSSMPIRDLDAFGAPREERLTALGNRGASGIDGIVSGGLGASLAAEGPTVVVLGDIALVHDMNGLLATREDGIDAVFVVIHNDGGGIFHMLPVRDHEPWFTPYFATPHGLDFRHAAELHGLPYERVEGRGELSTSLGEALETGGSRLIEVRTDREANRRRHEEVADAVRRSVRALLAEGE